MNCMPTTIFLVLKWIQTHFYKDKAKDSFNFASTAVVKPQISTYLYSDYHVWGIWWYPIINVSTLKQKLLHSPFFSPVALWW